MKDNFKVVFMGTPDIAKETLKKLIDSKTYRPSLVLTQKDKPVGRKKIITAPPVKILAEENDIEVFQPDDLRQKDVIDKIKDLAPDIIIVIAYGKIIPKEILEIPKFGALNIHASLLPKYRGASPIQNAVLNGEHISGVTIMNMDEKLDHGSILAQKEVILDENETSETLFEKMSEIGPDTLLDMLPKWLSGEIVASEQDHKKATFTKILHREDGKITDEKTAEEIDRIFRAFYPWPGVYINLKTKEDGDLKLKITKLSLSECETSTDKLYLNNKRELILRTKEGCVNLEEVQPESKNKMSGEAFYQGYKNRLSLT